MNQDSESNEGGLGNCSEEKFTIFEIYDTPSRLRLGLKVKKNDTIAHGNYD